MTAEEIRQVVEDVVNNLPAMEDEWTFVGLEQMVEDYAKQEKIKLLEKIMYVDKVMLMDKEIAYYANKELKTLKNG